MIAQSFSVISLKSQIEPSLPSAVTVAFLISNVSFEPSSPAMPHRPLAFTIQSLMVRSVVRAQIATLLSLFALSVPPPVIVAGAPTKIASALPAFSSLVPLTFIVRPSIFDQMQLLSEFSLAPSSVRVLLSGSYFTVPSTPSIPERSPQLSEVTLVLLIQRLYTVCACAVVGRAIIAMNSATIAA